MTESSGPGPSEPAQPAAPRGGGLASAASDVRLWFAPERLREEGGTPDYRFSLANERTFLAWLRTAMALVGGGFAVDQFLPETARPLRLALALVLLAGGALCALRAISHWVRCERAMRRGEDLPMSRFPAVLGLAVGVVALLMVIVAAFGWGG
ncbi:membrane protein [Streptomyces antimycoticus]|uniref:Membrane protein n=1 Tax=Streptomyces antimycoticus TaxID=68175 RepID=A0A499UXY4_9ACTN|nr:membrane protein [Streptomyces antimycoticus]